MGRWLLYVDFVKCFASGCQELVCNPEAWKAMRLILYGAELLNVYGLHHFLAVGNRRFLESLACAEFLDNAGLFEFTFEFL